MKSWIESHINATLEQHSITIRRGNPLMHIEFITRVGKPSPCMGEYEFQYMSEEEIKMYIPTLRKVSKNFDELAKIWFKNRRGA